MRTFFMKHWKSLVAALTALGLALLAAFRIRKDRETPIVLPSPSPLEQADALHEVGVQERRALEEAQEAQERAARAQTELEASARLRATEGALRAERGEAEKDIASANAYADRVSRRKEGTP